MNNMWSQLVREPVAGARVEIELPSKVVHRQAPCARPPLVRRPRHFRKETVKPEVEFAQRATGSNRWGLSAQQFTAIALIAQGASRSRISKELGITGKTLNSHLQRVRDKMLVHTTDEAVMVWMRDNLYNDLQQRCKRANQVLLFNLRRRGVKF